MNATRSPRQIVRIRDLTSAPRYTIIREIDRLQRELRRRAAVSMYTPPGPVLALLDPPAARPEGDLVSSTSAE